MKHAELWAQKVLQPFLQPKCKGESTLVVEQITVKNDFDTLQFTLMLLEKGHS